jgi:hypothetical protein
MPDAPIPWFGLAVLIAMFVLPFLPRWLFEGPRSIKHWPQRHVCGECGAPWADGHLCAEEAHQEVLVDPVPVLDGEVETALGPPAAGSWRASPGAAGARPRTPSRGVDLVVAATRVTPA